MKKLPYLFFLFLISCFRSETPLETIILLNDGWEFKKLETDDADWRPANVPGTVHTDLLLNGEIEDPFYACNEKELQWIGTNDWIYRKSFYIDDEILINQHITLVFDGLDTYAHVKLNGEIILEANNMFRQWEIDCKKYLVKGENNIEIIFLSAENRFLSDSASYGYPIPGGRWVFARKAAYHFGWDWGPKFVTAGIWKPVYLKIWRNHKINDLYIITNSLNDKKAELSVQFKVISDLDEKATLTISNEKTGEKYYYDYFHLNTITKDHQMLFSIKNPKLWWCNGLGEAYLYPLRFEIKTESGFVYSAQLDYGIRTVEVVRGKDEFGESFYIRLNGKPVFIKGANIIPLHSFASKIKPDDYENIVNLAVESNMNMLRVWGGGIYNDDSFYQLCDEKGILVWQDFMFACAMYPFDELFKENVWQEAVQQICRLRNHPSLALWCGNNESDEGWHNWGWQKQYNISKEDSIAIWAGYNQIFHQLLPKAVQEYDGQRYYLPSSPVHGWGRKESLFEGDAHYWGVWWGKQPFDIYYEKVPRFMSEYGFQAAPALPTIRSFQPGSADTLYSQELKCHQKHPTGFETINEYLEIEALYPKTLEQFIFFSQLIQAKGIRMAIDAHRSAKPRCMGTLYWQLNDCWPVTSWAGTDFYNNRKAMQYAVKEGFKNIIVSVIMKQDSGSVYLVSDRIETTTGKFELTLKDFSGNQLWNYEKMITLSADISFHVLSFSKTTIPGDINPKECYLSALFTDSSQSYQSYYFFTNYGELNLPDTDIETTIVSNENRFEIELKTDHFAAFVHLWLPDDHAVFSDNFLHLEPGKTAKTYCQCKLTLDEFKKQLKVMHLKDYLN